MDQVDLFLSRIDILLAENGETDRALSLRAIGKPDQIRSCRKNHHLPNSVNLQKLADATGVTTDWLLGRVDERLGRVATKSDVSLADNVQPFQAMPSAFNDLPIVGTALGHNMKIDGDGNIEVEQTILEHTETIRCIQRPAALAGVRQAYAVYIQGDSMAPRFEPGELAVVDPRKPPQLGNDVIVQLVGDADENGDSQIVCALIKRLKRRSATWIDLQQFNPAVTFRVEAKKVASIHRIVSLGEMLGA